MRWPRWSSVGPHDDGRAPRLLGRGWWTTVNWGEEIGLRRDRVGGRGDTAKGQMPVVQVNPERGELNILLALTNRGKVGWKIFAGTTNADGLIDFLMRLFEDAEHKVIVTLDTLKVFPARKIKAWPAAHEETVEVLCLPGYSPELDPAECLNAEGWGTRTGSKAQLKRVAISDLRKLREWPQRVHNDFEHRPVRYVA